MHVTRSTVQLSILGLCSMFENIHELALWPVTRHHTSRQMNIFQWTLNQIFPLSLR